MEKNSQKIVTQKPTEAAGGLRSNDGRPPRELSHADLEGGKRGGLSFPFAKSSIQAEREDWK